MRFPSFLPESKKTPTTSNQDDPLPTAANPAPSNTTSTSQLEKEEIKASQDPSISSGVQAHEAAGDADGEKTVVEATPIEEAAALDKLSDEPEYPQGAKLAIIVASLCLSIFLMALVSYAPLCEHISSVNC